MRAFVTAAGEVLREREYANMAMLRGFSLLPKLPVFGERYSLNPGAVAAYPMYQRAGKDCWDAGDTDGHDLRRRTGYAGRALRRA